ncbi:MAG: hypothetical protein IPK71_20880 [Myxococcales bacterium]|jgi:triacylglycerol lipase|nr:hypothetical protein [Myxococcales bacterium]
MHRVYLSPGMFGFAELGAFGYFAHLRSALLDELKYLGLDAEVHVVDVPPTASIRRRAARLAEAVAETSGPHDDIHLVGHSTGGLDARLVASPSARLPTGPHTRDWIPRLRSVTTMNTPHYGTPLASFFATKAGQQMLYAVSAFTFVALTLSAPPLTVASALVLGVGRMDKAFGLEVDMLGRLTESLLGVLEPAKSREVRAYLDAIKGDQGAVIQLTPEAMDLFQAGVEDRAGVRYQCVVGAAPPPTALGLAKHALSPWRMLSHALFTTLYGITARYDDTYPCAAAVLAPSTERLLDEGIGRLPGARSNDGVVPVLSQVWGDVVWAGHADHLDVLGHFHGPLAGSSIEEIAHSDWLTSGAQFDRADFAAMTQSVVRGMLL